MSIDSLKLDNPLAMEAVPQEKLAIAFPARGGNHALEASQWLIAYTTVILLAIAAAMVMNEIAPELAPIVAAAARPLTLLLGIAVIARVAQPLLVSSTAVLVVLVLVSYSLLVGFFGRNDAIAVPFSAFVMLTMLWNIAELALHYHALDAQICRSDHDAAKQRREEESTQLMFLSIFAGIATCLWLPGAGRLPGLLVIGTFMFFVASGKSEHRGTGLKNLLWNAVTHYLSYPDAAERVPGLIGTKLPLYWLRPSGFVLLAVSLAAAPLIDGPLIDGATSPLGLGYLAWIAVATFFIVATLGLAVAFTASPTHFDAELIPYDTILRALRSSDSELDRQAYFWGLVEADGSPILIDRSLFFEHAHILGNSGSGKSSMRLTPLIEQTIGFGDRSLFFLDLKADKFENLAACLSARDELKARTGVELPIRIFTIEPGLASHVFNPFTTPGWKKFSVVDKTSIIAEALNLYYGSDYARGHFSAVNADTIEECLLADPTIASFFDLHATLCELAANPATYLGNQRRADYVHVAQSVQKLASFNILNVTKLNGDAEVLENQIDLAAAFQTPGIYYFHLPSVTSPVVAASVGRLVTKFLMVAAKSASRKTKVQIIIDEFQRMIAETLEGFFQLARGYEISIVIANQSLSDLRASGEGLIHAIEGNCAIRQWLSVTTADDLEQVMKLFGTRKEVDETITHNQNGRSVSRSLRDVPRITITDLHQVSDDPFLSVTKILGSRRGYARYRGIPFVSRAQFHISPEEYQRRTELAWPSDLAGLMEVQELALPKPPVAKKSGDHKAKPRPPVVVETPQPFDDLFL